MTFAFYDLETTGLSPAFDQPLQFAAILTDDEFREIEQVNLRCRIAPHIIPSPWALAVTGVRPAQLLDPALPTLFEFTQDIGALIDRWSPAIWTGFNSIRFDEEMLRQAFYQNLQPDIFATQFNGNTRFDLLTARYAVRHRQPDLLEWPVDETGRVRFKLELIAPLNGFAAHNAHDALSDVEATIHIARQIAQRAPALWAELLGNQDKAGVQARLGEFQPMALVERNADGKTRRPAAKRNLGHLPDHLPRIEQVIEPDQKICPCGCTDMVKIGEDRTERLDIVPARFQIIVTVRPRYACRRCDAGVLQADTPNWLIEGGLPTEGTLAHIAVSKYADHLPLYRQCQIYGRGGVNLDRSTLANWCGVSAYHLAPVVDRMLVHLKRSGRLFMDETRAPVLDPKAGKTKTGYLWALTRDDRGWGGGDPPAVVFTYAPGRHGRHAMDILTGFEGILQVDGYTGYDALAEPKRVGGMPLTLAYCWAHSRRKLHDIYQKDGSEIAAEGLRRIAQLYKIEASVRGRSPEERLAARQAQSAPLIADFRLWLTQQRSRISAKSRLGEKLGYIHRHWDGLQIFLTDGRVEMDTNPVENTIRPITLNRKNALFAGHDEGGRTWARMASIIETCKLNAVDPFAYLLQTLTAIANDHPDSRIDDLMPWAFQKPSS